MVCLSIRQLLQQDQATLAQAQALDARAARLEVQLLLAHVLGASRAWLLAHDDENLPLARMQTYQQLLARRLAGEPMAYILGEREFYGLSLHVTADVLIPRPDTELLVELALACLPPARPAQVLDLGTGSGAIALAIAQARPLAQVLAVDRSEAALKVAQANAARLGIDNVRWQRSDWWQQLSAQRFDLIASNPPYIAAGDPHLTQGDLRFEPLSALAAGEDGLTDLRQIIADSPYWLAHGASLLLEHGWEQGAAVRALLSAAGLTEVATDSDLAGHERVSRGVWRTWSDLPD